MKQCIVIVGSHLYDLFGDGGQALLLKDRYEIHPFGFTLGEAR